MQYLFRCRLLQLTILPLALALGLTACLGLSSDPASSSTITINTTPFGLSPTPTAPAFLVGAYVSDNTPTATSGNIIVYVIFHHGQQPQPGAQVSLYFHFQDGGGVPQIGNDSGTQTTGSDGWAKFYISFDSLPPNMPIGIDVTVHFAGIPDIKKENATSFSVVSLTPTITPSAFSTGG